MDRGLLFVIGDFFAALGTAASASRAVETVRKPYRSDVKERSVDPTDFGKTGRF